MQKERKSQEDKESTLKKLCTKTGVGGIMLNTMCWRVIFGSQDNDASEVDILGHIGTIRKTL